VFTDLCRRGSYPGHARRQPPLMKSRALGLVSTGRWRFNDSPGAIASCRSGGDSRSRMRSIRAAAAWSKLIQPAPSRSMASRDRSGQGSSRHVTNPLGIGMPALMAWIVPMIRSKRCSGVMPAPPCGTAALQSTTAARASVWVFDSQTYVGRHQVWRTYPMSPASQLPAAPHFMSSRKKTVPNVAITSHRMEGR
jgi:hypothetical protein